MICHAGNRLPHDVVGLGDRYVDGVEDLVGSAFEEPRMAGRSAFRPSGSRSNLQY